MVMGDSDLVVQFFTIFLRSSNLNGSKLQRAYGPKTGTIILSSYVFLVLNSTSPYFYALHGELWRADNNNTSF